MSTSPSPQEVLAARAELSSLSLDVANDLYRSTWLASHVRLVELLPNSAASLSLLLAHALARNPAGGLPLEEWLPNTEFRVATVDELAKLIAHAISDMEQEDRWPNSLLAESLARLSVSGAQFIHEIEATAERQRPCSPYQYGPTHQMFWVNAGRLYLLEVHNES